MAKRGCGKCRDSLQLKKKKSTQTKFVSIIFIKSISGFHKSALGLLQKKKRAAEPRKKKKQAQHLI